MLQLHCDILFYAYTCVFETVSVKPREAHNLEYLRVLGCSVLSTRSHDHHMWFQYLINLDKTNVYIYLGDNRENAEGVVVIKELDPAAVRDIVDFCYSGKIKIDTTNVLNLLPAACLLQLSGVQEALTGRVAWIQAEIS